MPDRDPRGLARAGRGLFAGMLGTLVVFMGLLAVEGLPGWATWTRDYVIGNLVYVLPILLMVCRAALEPAQRTWSLLLAGGAASFLFGNVVYLYLDATSGVPFPSLADVGYLGVYPLLLAAIYAAMRSRLSGVRMGIALDAAIGTFAVGTLGAAAISPLVSRLWDGSAAGVVSLAYPLGDLVVVSAALGALGIQGRRDGLFWSWSLGLLIFCVADTVYVYRVALGTYEVGTWLDGLWALGIATSAAIAWLVTPRASTGVPGAGSLAVTGAAVLVAGAVLALEPSISERPLPAVLGLTTLVLGAGRVFVAFRQLRLVASLQRQVLTDDLTGVANRRALYERLDGLLATCPREDQPGRHSEPTALLIVDLDRFKEVNDTYGHAAGDRLLRDVSGRFARALETAPDHLLARLGGDEFAVLLPVADLALGRRYAERLLDSLGEPLVLEDVTLHVRASIGLAWAPQDATSRSDLMFAADAAMYAAKQAGVGLREAADVDTSGRRNRRQVAEDLHAAFDRDELTTVYQPVVDSGGRVVAVEALVRWQHPSRGLLLPGDFLEVAEEHHLSHRVTARVVDLALGDLCRWRATDASLRVSVNISAGELDRRLVDTVEGALARHCLPAEALVVEITETAMMRNPAAAQEVFAALKVIGVRLAVDDYGRGHSGLEYLLHLPVDVLKLDRVFTAEITRNPRAAEIVRSTIQLSRALGLQLVAEGVEDAAAQELLCRLGCEYYQGWHIGRPAEASAWAPIGATERLIPR